MIKKDASNEMIDSEPSSNHDILGMHCIPNIILFLYFSSSNHIKLFALDAVGLLPNTIFIIYYHEKIKF